MANTSDSAESHLAPATNAPVDENANPEVKKRKTHRLKQRFQVVRKLGQGTYGKVQLAINNETGQEVAIKTIKKSKVENDQDLIRIRREIQIMSSIHHPHIIHIYEVFENKDKIVLVMQYASGGELYDYVSYHKVLNDSDARRLFRQIATAIYYCHKNKICHRDLKLENILLDEKGNAKIADFGLSNVFDEKHFLQTFCGSPLYASPEIVRGLAYFGPEVDCWSLGVLLYTLVYGAMPFDGSNFKKLVKQISESSYYEPPNKSGGSDLIRKLLMPNPRDRATILDICTDEWVNQDFEHSLLQVAEDLSNLTPVRCDMLHALAPVSPTVQPTEPTDSKPTENETHNEEQEEDTKVDKDSKKRTVDNASFSASTAQVGEKKHSKKTKRTESKEAATKPETDKCEEPVASTSEIAEIATEEQVTLEPVNESIGTGQELEENLNLNREQKGEGPTKEPSLDKLEERVNESESLSKANSASSSTVSSPKRPGRLSIPKIWDSPSQDKVGSGSEGSPKSDKKAPFIPVGLKVSEAKRVIERRCSVDSKRGLVKRRDSLATAAELNKDNKVKELKKYAARSMSLNLAEVKAQRECIKPVAPRKSQNEVPERCIESSPSASIDTVEKEAQSQSKPSTPISDEDKSLAKQIIKKNIARAKLMEKQQVSVNSNSETTPLVAIENSNISIIQNTPKPSEKRAEMGKSRPSESLVAEPTLNAAPITRSYKKVTFTKDGACITESGKFYTHEGKDGYHTRVEKKSMVTHIISDDPTGINIQRSDSQSSSGSTDIFDDIFDDHWTGDVFSNMKSLFNNIFESSSRRFNERKSLRSRAESLERSSNDWFSKRQPKKSLFASEEDDDSMRSSNSIFDSQKSVFSSKSFFTSSFKSNLDKRLEDLMGPLTPRREMSKTGFGLPRQESRFSRESSLHRDSERDPFEISSRFGSDERANQSRQDCTRRRVEQWLHSDEGRDLDKYGTIGPKNFRRYMRTMTTSDSAGSLFNSAAGKRVQMSSSSDFKPKTSGQSESASSDVEVKFTLDNLDGGAPVVVSRCDIKPGNDTASEVSAADSGIKIAETSSLLEQLRTFGYKNLVNRRLSESSSTEDLDTNESSSELNAKSSGAARRDVGAAFDGNCLADNLVSETLVSFRRQHSKESVPAIGSERRRKEVDSSEVDFKSESVQERIHRKSYYSRFNEDSPSQYSVRQRRRSMTRFNEQSEFFSSSSSSSTLNRSKIFDSPLGLSSLMQDRAGASSSGLLDIVSDISSRYSRRAQSSSRAARTEADDKDSPL